MAKTLFSCGDIETKLVQWGLWSRGDGLGASALRKGDGVKPDITDAEGVLFDQLVCQLRIVDERAYRAIKGHYQVGRSVSEIAVELRVGRQAASRTLANAVAWLDGAVIGFMLSGETQEVA